MKKFWWLFSGGILGGILGWGLGYLRFPEMEGNSTFLLGFVTCLAFLALWRLLSAAGKAKASAPPTAATRKKFSFLLWGALFLVSGTLVTFFVIEWQLKRLKDERGNLEERIRVQSELKKASLQRNYFEQLPVILSELDSFRVGGKTENVPDRILQRIISFSQSLEPYFLIENDSLTENQGSPERGKLLISLVNAGLDSVSWARIRREGDFSFSLLKGANLRAKNLRGINLAKANLGDADLRQSDLSEADISRAWLWGANLEDAVLNRADLNNSNLSWVELNRAKMTHANLNGAIFHTAKLRETDLSYSDFQWGDLSNAIAEGANFTGVNLKGTRLTRANLSEVNLRNGNLNKNNMEQAIFRNLKLEKTDIKESDWFDLLEEYSVSGRESIMTNYRLVKNPFIEDYMRSEARSGN